MHATMRYFSPVVDLCRGLHLAPLCGAASSLWQANDLGELLHLASDLPWLHMLAAAVVLVEAVHSLMQRPGLLHTKGADAPPAGPVPARSRTRLPGPCMTRAPLHRQPVRRWGGRRRH
jgi:hypothetical protein